MPRFTLPDSTRLARMVTPAWSLIPLRIPTGWAVRHNGVEARRVSPTEIEFNDSQDIFWAVKLPPPDGKPYSTKPDSPWREVHVDAGWYDDHFRIVMLDPDWDHVRYRYTTGFPDDFIDQLEQWLLAIGSGLTPPFAEELTSASSP